MKIWLQFKFWENFAKQQNNWMWLATVLAKWGMHCRPPGLSCCVQHRHAPGHAAACLLGLARVSIRSTHFVAWIKPRAAVKICLFPLNPDTDELTAPPKFISLVPLQATRASQQLSHEPSNSLRPVAQALASCNPQPCGSSPNPAEAPP